MLEHNSSKGIRTLQRSIDILNCFNLDEKELTLTEISQKTNLAKSTATRLLGTLEANHYLEKDEHSLRYRLGRQIYFLGYAASKSIDLKTKAESSMRKLRDKTKETVNLYILDGEHRTCILQFESLHSVKHMVHIGQRLPLTVGASGKVLLAFQPQVFIESILSENQPLRENEASLLQELSIIRKENYTKSMGEREIGTSAAAAPIFNMEGEIAAAVSVSGPSQRLGSNELQALKENLLQAAKEISINLGYI